MRQASSDSNRPQIVWSVAISAWFASMMLLGGYGLPSSTFGIYFTGSSLLIIALAVWRLRGGMPSGAAVAASVLCVLSFVLLMAQLVPIPFELWKLLPGRQPIQDALAAGGMSPATMTASLSPSATMQAGLSLLPPLAAFLAVLSLPRKNYWMLSTSVLVCALLGCALGILQKGLGAASGLYFYLDLGDSRFATGTFGNRNFFATQLFTSIPFLAALAMVAERRFRIRPALTSLFTLIYIGLLVAVLAAVGSRAGILLAMASVLLTMLLVFRPGQKQGNQLSVGKGVLAMVIGIAVMAQASMVGILRLAETDPLTDFRNTISKVSFETAKTQFPVGSGFGTFVPVYQLVETPETIVDPYINHAHNEWLELAIEGGAPAIVLMALFVAWLAYAAFRAARLSPADPANAHIRAAGVAVTLLLLHSIVDFPLRTDALLALLGLCVGLLALASAPAPRWKPSSQKSAGPSKTTNRPPGNPRPFTSASSRLKTPPSGPESGT